MLLTFFLWKVCKRELDELEISMALSLYGCNFIVLEEFMVRIYVRNAVESFYLIWVGLDLWCRSDRSSSAGYDDMSVVSKFQFNSALKWRAHIVATTMHILTAYSWTHS